MFFFREDNKFKKYKLANLKNKFNKYKKEYNSGNYTYKEFRKKIQDIKDRVIDLYKTNNHQAIIIEDEVANELLERIDNNLKD